MVAFVALVGVVALLATTQLGSPSSKKFSTVGMSISDGGGGGGGGAVPAPAPADRSSGHEPSVSAGPPMTAPEIAAAPLPPDRPRATGLVTSGEMTSTAEQAESTFALDVDTGSFTRARQAIESGRLPDPSEVRAEEFVNYFDYGYAEPTDGGFAIEVDGGPTPFTERPDHRLLRVGLQTERLDPDERAPAAVTFVVDVSGSMGSADKLPQVVTAVGLLVDRLGPDDTVALVAYSTGAEVVLSPTPATERKAIDQALAGLAPRASTDLEAGLTTGYELARSMFVEDGINRVVLLSDGVANAGATVPEVILDRIALEAGDGIELTTVGVGRETYNDPLMEQLADQGDGRYAFLDSYGEAARLFAEEYVSTLQTVARDARVQVEFDPDTVSAYRLVGYENRQLTSEEFRDDSVDAGEIGAGHDVTALYEIVPVEDPAGLESAELATVRLRWQDPADGTGHDREVEVHADDLADDFSRTSASFHLAVAAAGFAQALRTGGSLAEVEAIAAAAAESHPAAVPLQALIEQAGALGR